MSGNLIFCTHDLRVVGIPLFGIPPFKGDLMSRDLSWCMRSIQLPKSITDFQII